MAKPKKVKDASLKIAQSIDPAVLVGGSLQDAINAVRKKQTSAPPEPAAIDQTPAPPLPDPAETPLSPDALRVVTAMINGQPPPPLDDAPAPVLSAFTGYGNVPDMGIPQSAAGTYDFGAPPPAPKAPSRPQTPKPPKPQVYKSSADDAELMEIVTLRTKIEAYMRIKPELARQISMPVRGSSAEDHRMTLAQCRTMLSSGNEEQWLEWGLVYGSQMLEGLLPFVRERVPEAVAVQLNADGFSDDVRNALQGKDDSAHAQNLRTAMRLCAVDLIGLISVSPWAMLGMGMLQMFTQKVHENNERMRAQYMTEAGRRGVPLDGDFRDI